MGESTHVTGALHVDLTAERIYSRSGTTNVSGQHSQIRYRQYVVGSGVVLGDTHGIDDVCRTRPSIQFRRLADIIRLYSTDRSGLLHRQSTDGLHELIVPLSSLCDEIPVFQARIKNVAHHAVQQRHVCTWTYLEVYIRPARKIYAPRISHYELLSFPLGPDDLQCDNWMGLGCIGANDE